MTQGKTMHFFNHGKSGIPSPRVSHRPSGNGTRRTRRRSRLRLEFLEPRNLLTTFTVTNTNDSGEGSLRQAISDVNADSGSTSGVIAFNIGGGGVQTIQPLSPLPTITSPVTIDGETQPGYAGAPLIVLNGSQAGNVSNGLGSGTDGLALWGDNSTVRGLDINGFAGPGILLGSQNDTVQSNYIGADATGMVAVPNGDGIQTYFASGLIGGSTVAERNLISGNSSYGIISDGGSMTIAGSYIGTDITGEHALSPSQTGVSIGGGASIVGGAEPGAGNLISGNGLGIRLGSAGDNVVEGNLIGTDATGTTALANITGIYVGDGASGNTIGGTTQGARNVISGNTQRGLYLGGAGVTNNLIEGNYIGTDITGTQPLGNGNLGIQVADASGNTIGGTAPGAGNIIADTPFSIYVGQGIEITSSNASAGYGDGNAIRGNTILNNGSLGISLSPVGYYANVTPNHLNGSGAGLGPNNLENYPVLAAATPVTGGTQVSGTLNSTPDATIGIDFFANDTLDPTGHGQGQYYLGTITVATDANGNASFTSVVPGATHAGQFVSATATDASGDTSEFSLDVPVFNAGQAPAVGALLAAEGETIAGGTPQFNDTIYVWNTNDSGLGSLRQAIQEANAYPGTSTITFNIGGGGVQTIQPLSPLPELAHPVMIDGESQPGYAGAPLIVLDGSQAGTGPSAVGLNIQGGNSTVRGLVVNQFNWVGIGCYSNDDTIQRCYVGTDVTGTIAEGNGLAGINVGGVGGLIGGTSPGQRNIISGNGSGVLPQNAACTIEGNYIGTDVTGEHALGNVTGVFAQGANLIGGDVPGAGNVISGNGTGVRLGSAGANVVEGNLIGTDATGNAAIPNVIGVYLADGASGSTIGGTAPAERNTVSGNSEYGIYLNGVSDNVIEGNFIGTDITGTAPLGNGGNVLIADGSDNTVGGTAPGAANVIAYGTAWFEGGVNIFAPSAPFPTGDSVRGNSIFGNAGVGIDLSFSGGGGDGMTPNEQGTMPGPNNLQNYPVLSAATAVAGETLVTGTLTSTPNTTFAVDVYANDAVDRTAHGQGQYYLGAISVTTDAGGDANFSATLPGTAILGQYISATATDPNGNTSEFSLDVPVYNPGEVPATGTFYVLNTNDSGDGSLRQAILDANAAPGLNTIAFDIARGGVQTTQPLSPLPTINDSVVIDGWTQPGFAGAPLIVLDGSKTSGDGLAITAGGSTIRGLVVNSFSNALINLEYGGQNVIEGDYLGVDATGTIAKGGHYGIFVNAGSANNLIGTNGDGINDRAEGNLISGNFHGVNIYGAGANNNVVAGNLVGTDVSGTKPLGNTYDGVIIGSGAQGNIIGSNGHSADDAAERNIISSNPRGVAFVNAGTSNNVVAGNFIGTDISGTKALGNSNYGVEINAAGGNLIGADGRGGDDAGERNIISANGQGVGIFGTGADGNIIAGNYIGTDVTGATALANTVWAVSLGVGADDTLIGTDGHSVDDAGQRNLISGNSTGVEIGSNRNTVAGNYIGTDATGTKALPNGTGILITGGAQQNLVGTNGDGGGDADERNVISGNSGNGVWISGDYFSGATGANVVAGNFIGTDVSGTSAIGNNIGVYVEGGAQHNLVGTNGDGRADAAERNIISGNVAGIEFRGANTNYNVADGNYIGTDVTSEHPLANSLAGIWIWSGAQFNLVGTNGHSADDAGQRNVISGNATGLYITDVGSNNNVVAGNYIGTDATGEAALANNYAGVQITKGAQANLIGANGDGAGHADERNIISGNTNNGIFISGTGTNFNTVAGNYIGTDASGGKALGNGIAGVLLTGGARNNLVGTNADGINDADERNVISANSLVGVWITDSWTPGPTGGNTVAGNYIGTDASGAHALGNHGGVDIDGGTQGNLIGTTGSSPDDAAARNIISGNVEGINIGGAGTNSNVVAGNYIGTDVTGEHALANSYAGIQIYGGAQSNRIGTDGQSPDDAGERNVISGNGTEGVIITGAGSNNNIVAGNYIGTDATGKAPLGNIYHGVAIAAGAQSNLIGTDGRSEDDAGQRNVIAANGTGVKITDAATNFNVVAGDYVGTDASGATALGNAQGVWITNGAEHNLVGTNGDGHGDSDEQNIVSGSSWAGVWISGAASFNTVAGNDVGTDALGQHAIANGFGIVIDAGAHDNLIGADGNDGSVTGNLVSGNGYGVLLNTGANANTVAGNLIGTDSSGMHPLGNTVAGVAIAGGANQNSLGNSAQNMPNTIAYNAGPGVEVLDTSHDNSIRGNAIYANAGLGIDLGGDGVTPNQQGTGPGPNDWQNYPVLASAYEVPGGVQVSGTLTSTPNATFNLDFYGNDAADPSGHGQGRYYLASIGVTTDADGNASFSTTLTGLSLGQVVSATATDADGNTSEFAGDTPVDIGTTTSITSDHPNGSVYGQTVTLTAAVAAQFVAGSPTGSVQYIIDGANLGAPVALSAGEASISISTLHAGPHTFAALYISDNTEYAGSTTPSALDESVSPATLTVTANDAMRLYGLANPAFTDTISGFVNGDTAAVVSGSASLTTSATTASPVGTYNILAAQGTLSAGDYNFSFINGTFTVTVAGSIYVLNPTASGALTLSGNSTINVPGLVMVNSNSAAAIEASGNASATAASLSVVGGGQTSGHATLSPAPVSGIAPFGDPLSSLTAPSVIGLTNYGAETLSGQMTALIYPGIYSQISVSGSAHLTMSPGTYIIEGGGFTVTGNASVVGSDITVVNAGTAFPSAGGNYGGITLSGNGSIAVSAPTDGQYAGIAIYQTRDNTRAISLGGNATSGLTGTIYAANALVTLSGNAVSNGSFVVGTLNVSGNALQAQIAAGGDGANDSAGIADTLLAGNLTVYVDNLNGAFTPDELARIGDAIQTWDSLLVPYHVSIVQVSDPSLANLVIDAGATSASGTATQGVLGCYNSAAGEITLLVGWNWYAGAEATGIAPDQFDFQTTATHELGHALGLGHSADPNSPMYESLASGEIHREPSVADLNIPDPPQGADPEMAAGFANANGGSDIGMSASFALLASTAAARTAEDLARDVVFAALANQASPGNAAVQAIAQTVGLKSASMRENV